MDTFIRTRELRAVERTVNGRNGSAIVLTGPRGSGKTAILKTLSASARLPIVSVRGSEVESTWPKSGLITFLASLDATLGTSSEASVAELLRHGLNGSPYEVSKTIESELRAGQCGDFLVLIDDVDLLDSSSRSVLGTATRLLSSLGMRSVFTMSTGSGTMAFSDITTLELEPIDTLGLIELGRTFTPPSVSEPVLEHIAMASAGSPVALKSILGALPASVLAGECPIPSPIKTGRELDALNRLELKDLDDSELVSIQYLACADYMPVSIFHRLPDSSLEALDALQAAGHVQRDEDRLFISTQALSASVYWSMGARRRIRLHGEILAVTPDDHAGLHAWHSSFLQVHARQSRTLFEAAVELAAHGRIRAAVAFTERALSLDDPRSNAPHLAILAKLMLRNAQFNLARRYLQFVSATDDLKAPHPSYAFLTVILDYVQDQRLSSQIFGPTVREHAETSPIDCSRLLGVGAILHLERWETREAEHLLNWAREIVPESNDFLAAVEVLVDLYGTAISGGELPSSEGLSRQVNTIRAGIGSETALILLARVLSLAERHTDARALLREFTTPLRSGHRIWTLFAVQVAFSNELRAGRYDRARATFERFDAAFREQRHFEVNHAYGASVFALLDGDLETAASEVRRARLLVPPGTGAAQEAQIAVRQARVAMAQRDFELASDHYRRARNIAGSLANPNLLRFHSDYALVLARLNQPDAAREALEELRRFNKTCPSRWTSTAIAICEAMVTYGEEGLQAFRELLRSWDGEHHEYLRARALFAFSDRLRELGYDSESEKSRNVAAEVFREIGIGLGDATCVAPGVAAESVSVLDLLTDKELAVVQLLARGAKNQAIAHELYVSVRTVELRLTNIFRKVGVKSRFDLMRRVTPELEARDDPDQRSTPSR